MKAQNKASNTPSSKAITLNHGSSEDLAAKPINSVNATILQIEGRIITLRVPSANVVELEERDIEINGLKAVGVRSVPSSETEYEKMDLTNALLFKVAAPVVPRSLKIASICELTWE